MGRDDPGRNEILPIFSREAFSFETLKNSGYLEIMQNIDDQIQACHQKGDDNEENRPIKWFIRLHPLCNPF
jgi:hypothetical protein